MDMTTGDTLIQPPQSPRANRGGAPLGSRNAARNGTKLNRLNLGLLPRGMRRQEANARRYRRELEQAVVDAKGEVNLFDAHMINECVTAELHAAVCRWLFQTRLERMQPSDIARCSEQILKARTVRNKAFEKLGLDRHQQNVLEALYNVTDVDDAPDPTTPTPGETNATRGDVDDHAPGG